MAQIPRLTLYNQKALTIFGSLRQSSIRWNTDCPNMHSPLVVSRQRRGNQAVFACVPNSRKWKKLQNYCEKLNETSTRTQKYNAFNRRGIYIFVFFNLINIPLDKFLFSSSFLFLLKERHISFSVLKANFIEKPAVREIISIFPHFFVWRQCTYLQYWPSKYVTNCYRYRKG